MTGLSKTNHAVIAPAA